MNDIRLALMCGTDIPVPILQASIHQPKIKEIALMGESDFFVAVQCLNINKDLLNQKFDYSYRDLQLFLNYCKVHLSFP